MNPVSPADPYLEAASRTGFDGLAADASGLWPVSVEVRTASYRPAGSPDLKIRRAHDGQAHFTALASIGAIHALRAEPQVRRVLFAAAQEAPGRRTPAAAAGLSATAGDTALDGDTPADVLIGVIDNGCPFAHPDLLRPDGKPRVLRLWNQQDSPLAARAPDGFDYGCEATRADLDALLAAARGPLGAVDSARAYRLAGLGTLRRRHSHGAHVTGLLAGNRRWSPSARHGVSLREDRREPVSSLADIAFVQLPQRVLDAVSVAHLEHHALDGVRYLVRLARARRCRRLAIVFAYESWVGAHDGSGWFETAVDEALAWASSQGLDAQLFTIAGNGRQRAAHAVVGGAQSRRTLQWRLPAGNAVPTWLELWPADGADLAGVEVEIAAPGRPPLRVPFAPGMHGLAGATLVVQADSPLSPGHAMALLRLAPTVGTRGGGAAPGLWTLTLHGAKGRPPPLVDARLGRLEPDPQAARIAQSAAFVGRTPAERDADALGTLNGHAGGQRPVIVGARHDWSFPYASVPARDARGHRRPQVAGAAAGHAALHGAPAAYSGAPSAGASGRRPDGSIDVDDGFLLPGSLSLGNAAAAVARLSGTSAAAPRLARRWVDQQAPFGGRAGGGPPPVDPALGRAVPR